MLPSGVSGVVPITEMAGENHEDTALLQREYVRAQSYLLTRNWCFGIGEVYFGIGLGGVVVVFLVRIDPVPDGVDEWLWVIVGDIPSAYIVLDDCLTPMDALRAYIELMQKWVELARFGRSSSAVIPVDTSATPENAELLQRRLNSLQTTIIPWLEVRPPVQ